MTGSGKVGIVIRPPGA